MKNNVHNIYDNNNTLISDEQIIVNLYNDHFSTIAQNMANLIKNSNYYSNNVKINQNSLFLNPTNVNEILNIINSLDINKSTGHDNISNKILKICSNIILVHFW